MRLLSLVFGIFITFQVIAQDFDVKSFGAIGDGVTLNTMSIQNAIDRAHIVGGGNVVFSSGIFLTGSIELKSGVNLYVDSTAIILGSNDPKEYYRLNRWKALILADSGENIGISGKGLIDGQGRDLALHLDSLFQEGFIDSSMYNFIEMRPKYLIRPQLIEFVNCKNIEIRDITLKDAACWVQTYDKCDSLNIVDIKVDSDAYWNNDGIDIQDCTNVLVSGCDVNSSDDGICLKSQYSDYSCENIIIENCRVRSSASAVKFGTVSHGGFHNIKIKNIKVYDTFRSVIAIECVDGAVLDNVDIDSIIGRNCGNAIFIRLGERSKKEQMGILRNVSIRNVDVEVAFERPDYAYEVRGPALPFFHNTFPSSITGIPGHPVENVTLENIYITYPGKANKGLAYAPLSEDVPEKIDDYPEFSMFGELPAWGFYIRHVEGLHFSNVELIAKDADYRPSIVMDDVKNLTLKELIIRGDKNDQHVVLKHVKYSNIEDGIKTKRIE